MKRKTPKGPIETLEASLTDTLLLTGGKMPVTMLMPDVETANFCAAAIKGRTHCRMVSFSVNAASRQPSVKGLV